MKKKLTYLLLNIIPIVLIILEYGVKVITIIIIYILLILGLSFVCNGNTTPATMLWIPINYWMIAPSIFMTGILFTRKESETRETMEVFFFISLSILIKGLYHDTNLLYVENIMNWIHDFIGIPISIASNIADTIVVVLIVFILPICITILEELSTLLMEIAQELNEY